MRMLLVLLGLIAVSGGIFGLDAAKRNGEESMKTYRELTPEEHRVIVEKGTEYPGTGEYLNTKEMGTYVCRRCGAPVYRSEDKFDSGCGWPAFDDEISGAVEKTPDADGRRTEILCAACGGHLGHVFVGERLTPKNVRHCVNSISLRFIQETRGEANTAYFAAGCFWGVEHLFKREPGVTSTEVGYMGGLADYPTYRQVCAGTTGHAEVLKVVYDPKKTDFDKLCRLFFEIHDFTQTNRQGPDIGEQYRSEIFTLDAEQEKIAKAVLEELRGKGFKPATKISQATAFWRAEEYHQDYYGRNGQTPYCHARRKIF